MLLTKYWSSDSIGTWHEQRAHINRSRLILRDVSNNVYWYQLAGLEPFIVAPVYTYGSIPAHVSQNHYFDLKYICGKFVKRGSHIRYMKYFQDWFFLSRPYMRKTFLFNPVYIKVTISVLSACDGVLSRSPHRCSAIKHYHALLINIQYRMPCQQSSLDK